MPRCCRLDRRAADRFLVIAALALGLLSPAAGPGPAFAQTALEVSAQRRGPVAQEKREELYRLLHEQAEILEKQAAVVKTVAKLVGPTVVHIEADVSAGPSLQYGRGRHVEEAGSGVIIQRNGKHYVLTNRHVIRGAPAEGIKISLADGRLIHPTRVWKDPDTDVAILAIETPELVAARLGESSKMDIGDFVLAVGSPFGLSHSVTYGIVSAKGRRDLELGDASVVFQDFIQTDAAINPGNSGGPLINLRGEVIGINTAIASNSGGNEGIGFAIPIDMFMFVATQLIDTGTVARAFLGVNLDAKFGPAMAAEVGLPRPAGARVNGITPGSPAEVAKLRVGDVILQFNGTPVEDDCHLVNLVSLTPLGKAVPMVVFRDRTPITIQVQLADRANFKRSE